MQRPLKMMKKKNIQEIGKFVIETEASALSKLASDLPADFSAAIDAVLETKGRVVVSGVGKSGHVGRKIAATLASTGTPAGFVHATEASHGDLGMITPNDFCLLISNSGETSELYDILAHTRRFGILTAVISSSKNSTLIQAADFKLLLTDAPEACTIGMAPTTSTILTMALGDALAVALMEQRDFKPEDFKVLHPGGNLGLQMLTVSQLMRKKNEMAIVKEDLTMSSVVSCMTQSGFGVAILVDENGMLSGIITDGDLRRNINDILTFSPRDIATLNPTSVKPTDLVSVALEKMEKSKVYAIVVIENDKPIGLLRMHDVLRSGIK
jgi:arabinose-5-phosphate isomerase